MEADKTADEILSGLKLRRKNLLLSLFRHGELRTRELREKAGVPSGSMQHHIDILLDWGLISEVGRTTESGGIPERVFGLTDDGSEFVDDYLTDADERPDSYELRVERLEDEIADLQTTNEKLEHRIEDLEENSVPKESFNELIDRLEAELF